MYILHSDMFIYLYLNFGYFGATDSDNPYKGKHDTACITTEYGPFTRSKFMFMVATCMPM